MSAINISSPFVVQTSFFPPAPLSPSRCALGTGLSAGILPKDQSVPTGTWAPSQPTFSGSPETGADQARIDRHLLLWPPAVVPDFDQAPGSHRYLYSVHFISIFVCVFPFGVFKPWYARQDAISRLEGRKRFWMRGSVDPEFREWKKPSQNEILTFIRWTKLWIFQKETKTFPF